MSDEHDDEAPPASSQGRTPAERAGATPLDPERFKAHKGMPVGQRRREILGKVPAEEELAEPVVRRRRRSRPGRSTHEWWFPAAAAAAAVGLVALALAWISDREVAVADPAAPELVAVTPVLSARRVPELITRPSATRNLAAALDPVIARASPETCVQVRDGDSALFSRNEGVPLMPASNLKLVTGAAVLSLLDPSSRLTTRVATDGAPTDGKVVRGNLYLIGGGDPLLSTSAYLDRLPHGRQPSTDLEGLADQIAATGIRRITGSVVGDESRYDRERTAGEWPDRYITQGQVAPLSALLVDDTWTAASGPGGDPARHAASVLTDLLIQRGVSVAGQPTAGVAPESASPLVEVDSATISELVDEGLRFSDNTTMELLLKEVGLQTGGTGSTEAGLAAVRGWLDGSGLPTEEVVIEDGSGLSETNRVTCSLLSSLLERDGSEGVIAAGLARPGEDGTLDDKLLAAELDGRLRAKTGTLRSVSALSGWLRTVPESDLGFSILINRPGSQVGASDISFEEDLLVAMLGYPDRPDPSQVGPVSPAAPQG